MLTDLKKFIGSARSKQGRLQLEIGGANRISSCCIFLVGILGYLGDVPVGFLTFLMLGFVSYELIKRIDQGFPLTQVAALIAVLQWLVGPWLTYNVQLDYGTYGMRVDSVTYFSYAFPGTAAFILGLLVPGVSARQRGIMRKADRLQFVQMGVILAIFGQIGAIAGTLFPGSLAFVFHVISQLRYVAVLYFLYSRSPFRFLFAGICILSLFVASAASGMFHGLLLWIGIFSCYWCSMKKRKIWVTVLVIAAGMFVSFTFQGIKGSYRAKIWHGEEGSLSEEIRKFWSAPNDVFSEANFTSTIIRVNQGWIIAAIMENVPAREPYAAGETVRDAVTAALLPRLLAEDKANSGGQVEYRRFTGLPLLDSTAMGLSLLGESYANFGPLWGVGGMFIFGLVISLPFALSLRFSLRHSDFYLWLPVIFCDSIKAESNFVSTLNSITKGSILILFLYWIIVIKLFPSTRKPRRSVAKIRVQHGN